MKINKLMFSKKSFSTQEIIDGLQKGKAVEEITTYLYRRFRPIVRQVIPIEYHSDADDVLQNSLISLLRHIQNGRFNDEGNATLETYFYTIARNHWLKIVRTNQRREAREQLFSLEIPTQDNVTPHEKTTGEEEDTSALAIFNLLGPMCRKIIILFHLEKKTVEEIAKMMEMTAVNVRVKKHRCMQKLSSLVHEL